MGVKLNAALGGSVELVPTNTASNYTATMPANTGTVVTTGSTAVVSQTMMATGVAGTGPAFSAYMSTNQSVTNGVSTKINFNTEAYDTNSNYDTSTYRFTPTVAGYYLVTVSLVNTGNATTGTYPQIWKTGAQTRVGYTSATSAQAAVTDIIYMNGSTDYLEAYVTLSGTTPTVSSNSGYTYFQACLIRGA